MPEVCVSKRRTVMSRHTPFPSGNQRTIESSDRKSTRLNSSHSQISYAVFCLKKKKNIETGVSVLALEGRHDNDVSSGRIKGDYWHTPEDLATELCKSCSVLSALVQCVWSIIY